VVVTFHHATLTTMRLLSLTRAGLAPAGTRQLAWRTDMIRIPVCFSSEILGRGDKEREITDRVSIATTLAAWR
jgi:hypothetical protein